MIKRLIVGAAIALALSGCDAIKGVQTAANASPSPQVIADARTAVLGVEQLYSVAVIVADKWSQPENRCGRVGAPQPPICNTPAGIIAVNKAAVTFKAAALQAETYVLKASPQQSDLTLGIDGIRAAWATYQTVAGAYGIKTE